MKEESGGCNKATESDREDSFNMEFLACSKRDQEKEPEKEGCLRQCEMKKIESFTKRF